VIRPQQKAARLLLALRSDGGGVIADNPEASSSKKMGSGNMQRGEQPQELHTGARSRGLISSSRTGPACPEEQKPTPQKMGADSRRMCSLTAHRLHCALPPGGRGAKDAAAERRDAQDEDEFHSAAQARTWAGTATHFDADRGFGLWPRRTAEWAAWSSVH
jgi:hypothetical protein